MAEPSSVLERLQKLRSQVTTPPVDSKQQVLQRLRAIRAKVKGTTPPRAEDVSARTGQLDAFKVMKGARQAIIDSGGQPRGEPFVPPVQGTRNFLLSYSKGNLDITRQTLGPTAEEDLGADYLKDFAARNPSGFAITLRDKDANSALAGHLRALVHVNHSPPTGKEKLDALDSMANVWRGAAANGRLMGLQNKPNPLQGSESLSPDLIRQTFSKVLDDKSVRPDLSVLSTQGPLGDERAAYEALGGRNFLSFLQRHQNFYVARNRWEGLLGHKVEASDQGPITTSQVVAQFGLEDREEAAKQDSVPTDPASAFRLDTLSEVSPLAAGMLSIQQNSAVADAQSLSKRMRDSIREKGALLGPLATPGEEGRFKADVGKNVATLIGGAMNLATLGMFHKAAEFAGAIPEVVGFSSHQLKQAKGFYFDQELSPDYRPGEGTRRFRNARAGMLRNLSVGRPDFTSPGSRRALEIHDSALANFPGVSDEQRDQLSHELWAFTNTVQDRMQWWSKNKVANALGMSKFFSLGDPAVQNFVGNTLGAVVDDEATFFMTLATSPTLLKGPAVVRNLARKFQLRQDFRLGGVLKKSVPKHTFSSFDDATTGQGRFSLADAENKSRILNDIVGRLNKEVKDPTAARAITARLQEVLSREFLELDPTTESFAHQSISRASKILDEIDQSGAGISADRLKLMHEAVAPVIGDLPFTDAAFVLRGADDLFVNTATSAELARRTQKWLDAQRGRATSVPQPRRPTVSSAKATEIQVGLMEEAQRVVDGVDRANRVGAVLDTVTENVTLRRAGLERQRNYHSSLIDEAATEYNTMVGEQLIQTAELDFRGGTLHRPNPAAGTPLFQKAADALADHTGAKLNDMLFSKKGTPNRRAIQAIGGPELVRQVDDLIATEARLTNEAIKAGVSPVGAIAARREIRTLFQDQLHRFIQESNSPIRVPVQPAPSPAGLRAQDSIRAKLDLAFRGSDVIDLSTAELAYLNRHRPTSGPLVPRKNVIDNLRPTIEQVDRASAGIDGLNAFRRQIDQFRDGINEISKTGAKIATKDLPAAFRKNIEQYLDDPAREVLDLNQKYVSIVDQASPTELTALEAWREALKDTSIERRALDNNELLMSGIEANTLPPEISSAMLRESIDSANGMRQFYQYEAKLLNDLMEKELKPTERVALFSALRDGTAVNDKIGNLLITHRLELLEDLYKTGAIDAELLQQMSGSAYYHGVYFSSDQAARLSSLEGQFTDFIPKRFAPLRIDPKSLKFARPEVAGFGAKAESFWVQWRRPDGKVAMKKGFATPEDAGQFLDDLPPDQVHGTRPAAAVNPPVRFDDKLLAGLVPDPAISGLKMTESLVAAAHNQRIALSISKSRLARTVDQITAETGTPPKKGVIELDGEKFIRVDSEFIPALRGKYVNARVFKTLNNFSDQLKWVTDLTDAVTQAATKDTLFGNLPRNKAEQFASNLAGGVLSSVRSGLTIGASLFSATKVALNARALRNGMMGNVLFYARQAGLETLSFAGAREFMRGTREAFRTFRNPAARLKDPYWKALVQNDNIRIFQGSQFTKTLEGVVDKHWTSMDAVGRRIDDARGQFEAAVKDGDRVRTQQWAEQVIVLQQEAERLGRDSWKGFMKDWKQTATGLGTRVLDELSKPGGETAGKIWNSYTWSSLDIPSKYATLKYLVEVEGLSMGAGLDRISMFFQHLHRVSKGTKKNLAAAEGALFAGFASDQLRILGNSLQHNALQLTSDMLSLTAYNSAILSAHGKSVSEYTALNGRKRGYKPGLIPWLDTMAKGIVLPWQDSEAGTGVEFVDVGHAYIDIFDNQNPNVRGVVDNITKGSGNVTKFAVNSSVAIANRFAAGGLLSQFIGAAYSGKDENGDPLRDITDFAGYVFRQFALPPQAPGGRDFDTFWRTLPFTPESDIDPRTLKGRNTGDLLKSIFANIRTASTSQDALTISLSEFMTAQGRDVSFVGNEAFNDLLSTMRARAGGRGDGTIDRKVARDVTQEWVDKHLPQVVLPDGTKVDGAPDATRFRQLLRDGDKGTTRLRVNSLRVDHMIQLWTMWRSAHTDIDPEIDKWFQGDIVKKIVRNRMTPNQIKDLSTLRSELRGVEEVPDDVKQRVATWHSIAIQNAVDKAFR